MRKPKYNIEDLLYYMENNEIKSNTVSKITIGLNRIDGLMFGHEKVFVRYLLFGNMSEINESDLFSTINELLESLKSKYYDCEDEDRDKI